MSKPSDSPICRFIGEKLYNIPRAGSWLFEIYKVTWKFVNYALVGGIGVLINYLVWAILLYMAPGSAWFITNFIAIFSAWLWNFYNSVGPWGWLWGFKRRPLKSR